MYAIRSYYVSRDNDVRGSVVERDAVERRVRLDEFAVALGLERGVP